MSQLGDIQTVITIASVHDKKQTDPYTYRHEFSYDSLLSLTEKDLFDITFKSAVHKWADVYRGHKIRRPIVLFYKMIDCDRCLRE